MEGYLYQRGKVKKTWYLRYGEPTLPDRKRRTRNVRIGCMSKSKAEARKREILREYDEGTSQERVSSPSVAQFLSSWLEVRRHNLAPTTFIRYKRMVKHDVIPVIGTVQLLKVQIEHIERIHAVARKRGLSERSCLHIHRMLHTAFRDAVRKKKVLQNVVSLAEAPTPVERELVPMSRDRVRLLIAAARGSRLEVPVAVSSVTGLRRGEILALKWRNIDLDKGSLFVAESLEQTREYGLRFKCPKSKSSRRFVPLSPECVELLHSHKAEQDAAKGSSAYCYDDQDLVFSNPDGSPWPPDTFTAQFGKLAALVGLKGFRFHDMRHAFASLTLADGKPIKEVSVLMGHSSANVTLSVYARSIEGMGREVVNDLSRSLLT
jgi:integrase